MFKKIYLKLLFIPIIILIIGSLSSCSKSVNSIDDLISIKNGSSESYEKYKLSNDIDLNGAEWEPIKLYGEFDGNNHVIRNFKITLESDNLGLFSYVYGVVKNLTLSNVEINIKGEFNNIGVLAGNVSNYSTRTRVTFSNIINCKVYGTIKAPNCNNVGGIIGDYYLGGPSESRSDYHILQGCSNNTNIIAKNNVGGIVGSFSASTKYDGTIRKYDLYVDGNDNLADLKGKECVGGIIGKVSLAGAFGSVNFSAFNNSGQISGVNNVGGTIGIFNYSAKIKTCINEFNNSGKITGELCVGGVIGYIDEYYKYITGTRWDYPSVFNISNSINSGDLIGDIDQTGGIVGVSVVDKESEISKTTSNCKINNKNSESLLGNNSVGFKIINE